MSDSAKYFDRELSWLEFNQRVLHEAFDVDVPLLERLKFLAISASNLDEFYRVRVGALHRLIENNVSQVADSGLTPDQQLTAVNYRLSKMVSDQYECYLNDLSPKLVEHGLVRLSENQLNAAQKLMLKQIVDKEILSILTPMAVEPGEFFPQLQNQTLNICVRLGLDPSSKAEQPQPRFAVIPMGQTLPRCLSLPSEAGLAYMHLEDVVIMSINKFFPGEEILECATFRPTRNAEVEVQELTPYGLAVNMADVLQARTTSSCVRVEVAATASAEVVEFLAEAFEIVETEIYRLPGPLALGEFMSLASRRGFERLQYQPWPPVNSPSVPKEDLMFDILAEKDVLLIHPYDSFEPVVRLLQEAAEDPDVISIKQTLYRISRNSPIIAALKKAIENGKHVSVLLELKARFDESRNLKQARELEAVGAQVILGVKGLKTHAKICIIVRREPHGIQRYMHFGTGNYNEVTARIYSDVSLLTSNEDLGADAIAFFNSISGYSQPPQSYRKLEAAPLRLREALKEMIEAEAERALAGLKAKIVVKVNAITDTVLIDALYAASQAGVEILLNVRGICCLKPGVKGMSENIRVISIVDRFLEHARIMYFYHGGDKKVFISSADWMSRNLDNRKELLTPVEDTVARQHLINTLASYFNDNVKASVLQPDGTYTYLHPEGNEVYRSQEKLYQVSRDAVLRAQKRQRTMFEPHRAEDDDLGR